MNDCYFLALFDKASTSSQVVPFINLKLFMSLNLFASLPGKLKEDSVLFLTEQWSLKSWFAGQPPSFLFDIGLVDISVLCLEE